MSEEQEQTTLVTESNAPRTQGRVKWFNNKAGYGFITSSSGEEGSDDVFVHHSALETGAEQYKYLVAGEYVEFCRCETNDEAHKWQAGNVKGVNGGKLMCETRNENRTVRTGGREEHRDVEGAQVRRRRPFRAGTDGGSQQSRYRGGGPRGPPRTLVDEAGVEWELVRRRDNQQRRGRRFQPNDEDA
tara:strand:- start:4238 stop:4798 length:561 start_codon:yes stop_codon:yes gene_type:complete